MYYLIGDRKMDAGLLKALFIIGAASTVFLFNLSANKAFPVLAKFFKIK
jgi:hypothetical protein